MVSGLPKKAYKPHARHQQNDPSSRQKPKAKKKKQNKKNQTAGKKNEAAANTSCSR